MKLTRIMLTGVLAAAASATKKYFRQRTATKIILRPRLRRPACGAEQFGIDLDVRAVRRPTRAAAPILQASTADRRSDNRSVSRLTGR